ncbi:ribonuclease H family protein [Paenibacillus sp. ACRRX]|uniref:ribonuclease H n=1 Tax=unclassified Paenibacillus TaxID=185978 RepID=UPI001EF63C45|nr:MULTISPECIES: ribonuclease H family protein [unclassified Paenibacillus]MCG7408736.1 ribonuclease H family protein [Paenibacillus sp. ACRRX]MDK8183505.1 ribonuclease H family protein [Paenibacillus sp. UMB4589-SE434]
MTAQKYYVVWAGNQPGIYTSWPECKSQVDNYKDAKYKSYPSKAEAEKAYREGWTKHWGKKAAGGSKQVQTKTAAAVQTEIDYDSISVDVGTKGNPGPIEYRGVHTQTGEVLFARGPIPNGTNNLGEFLAIVHSLAYLKQKGSTQTVYSDSRTALKWVREKKVATTLERNESTREVWDLVDRAVQWLQKNTYDNKLLKWETQVWGEIKADYGRK